MLIPTILRRLWRRARRRRVRQAPVPAPFALRPDAPEPVSGLALLVRYARRPEQFLLADAARLLVNGGETFAAMLAAIDAAAATVDLETYTLAADDVGMRFQAALAGAARRGVRVRLLYDYIGSRGLPAAFVRTLMAAGVQVAVYHPPIVGQILRTMNRRDHRKLLVVDGRLLFAGGINLADAYDDAGPRAGRWRDTHACCEGKAVALAGERLFEHGWSHAFPYPDTVTRAAVLKADVRRRWRGILTIGRLWRRAAERLQDALRDGRVAVQVVGNEEFRHRRAIHRAYLHAIAHARRYILIENAYFIPDAAIRRALARAVARGVQVAVAVPRTSDVPIVAYASRHLYAALLRRGIRIFEWPHGMLHAKTAVIDDAWAVVGSYNLDRRSFFHQLEAVLVVVDGGFAARLREQTLADLAQCREVTRAAHAARPHGRKLLESLAYAFRYWL
jgi:cardiolipin synthase